MSGSGFADVVADVVAGAGATVAGGGGGSGRPQEGAAAIPSARAPAPQAREIRAPENVTGPTVANSPPPVRWYPQTMLATIDAGGRVVIPKEVRERLGLRPGSRIELREVEGRLEVSPATTPVRLVERQGALVAVADTALPVLTAEQVREAVEATRR